MLVSAEPGIGKSRLCEAACERIAEEPHTLLRFQCSPHHTGSALYPVVSELAHAAGFVPRQQSADKLERLGYRRVSGIGIADGATKEVIGMKAGRGDFGIDMNGMGPLWSTGGRDFRRSWATVTVLMTAECRIDAVWRPGLGTALIEMDGGGGAL